MTDDTRRALSLKDLTPKQRRQLEAGSKRWHRKFAAQREAIRESGRITAKDLAVTILPVRDK